MSLILEMDKILIGVKSEDVKWLSYDHRTGHDCTASISVPVRQRLRYTSSLSQNPAPFVNCTQNKVGVARSHSSGALQAWYSELEC